MAEDDTFARLDHIRQPARTADEQTAENEVPTGSTEGEGGPGDGARQVRSAHTVEQQDSESQNDRDVSAPPQAADPSDQRGRAESSDVDAADVGSSTDGGRALEIEHEPQEVDLEEDQSSVSDPPIDPTESPDHSEASRDTADPEQIESHLPTEQSAEPETEGSAVDGAKDPHGATVDATNPEERAVYNLETDVEDGLTAREVVTHFDPAQANLEPMTADEGTSTLDRGSIELEALMDAARRAEIEGTRLSNRDRSPRDGDVNYIVDDPADHANTLTDIDFFHDGTLWEIKSATGENANINIERWVSKHMLPKFDRYLAAREILPGYEEAPIGCYFSSPGVAPGFKSAVESAGERWRLAHPDVTLKIRWRDEHHL